MFAWCPPPLHPDPEDTPDRRQEEGEAVHRMSGLDASFYLLEEENTPLHLAALLVFEGPAPSHSELLDEIAVRLPRVPRYRQRVLSVPLHLGRPVWVDDPRFRIGAHVRRAASPVPGNDEQLFELAARLLARRLDPGRPLWEIWLIDGLEGGRWALLAKVHHCMADGLAGIDLALAMLDVGAGYRRPSAEEVRAAARWRPAPEPSALDLVRAAAVDGVVRPLRRLGGAAVRGIGALGDRRRLGEFALGLSRVAGRLTAPAPDGLNGPIGPNRRWSTLRFPLADVQKIRAAHGGTVNDVVLAAVAAGYRNLLLGRRPLRDDTVVRTIVPVSVRGDGERGELTNRISAVLVNLPVGVADPLERLARVRAQTDDAKRSGQAGIGRIVTGLADAPAVPALLALASRVPARLRQNVVHTVTTNVPGPDFPLYVMGRRLTELYPYVPIAAGIRVATAILSYRGGLHIGVTGDADAVPDLDLLAKGVRNGVDELLGAGRS
ncbi:diacylglycerol O-acyltransferase [Actinomadura rubrobrunea]|uniref:Diacylglycerol O-acyltransferase n=2 Tax=Actinomadura rubrobrunea TaxID=115335 RepID=A0A9W6USS0_9ACTN|nr:diacylglycerol O-acyltransferase [Actinomadura rubrobrunea]